MYKSNDIGSPHNTAETSPEIDGTPITGVYRGWSSPTTGGGEGALRVVNGSDRQSTVSGAGTANPRDSSALSELESNPVTPARSSAFIRRSQQQQPPVIAEHQPYELPAGREK